MSPTWSTRAGLNAIAQLKRARLAVPLCTLLLVGCSYDYDRPADYGGYGYGGYGYYPRGYGYYPGPYGYYGPYYPYGPWFGPGFVRPLPHDRDHDHPGPPPPPPPAAAPPSAGQPSARSLEPELRRGQPPPRVERPRPPERPTVSRGESMERRQQLDRMRQRSSGTRPGTPRRLLDQD
jgi:hypothetical protein